MFELIIYFFIFKVFRKSFRVEISIFTSENNIIKVGDLTYFNFRPLHCTETTNKRGLLFIAPTGGYNPVDPYPTPNLQDFYNL